MLLLTASIRYKELFWMAGLDKPNSQWPDCFEKVTQTLTISVTPPKDSQSCIKL